MSTDELMVDLKRIACNYVQQTRECRTGALCFVLQMNYGGGCDRIVIMARSRSGRWIEKWESVARLGRFRVKTIPPVSPMYCRLFDATDGEIEVTQMLNGKAAEEAERRAIARKVLQK